MRLVPTNTILATVAKMDSTDPDAARAFLQLALYESMCDQAAAARAEVEPFVLAKMADTLVSARKSLLRNHVGKSVDEHGNTDDLPYAQGMAILETHIEKSLSSILHGAAALLFNRQHPRGSDGRWIHQSIGSGTSETLKPSESQDSRHHEASTQVSRWQQSGLIEADTPITVHLRRVDADNKPIQNRDGEVRVKTTSSGLDTEMRALEDRNADSLQIEQVSVHERDKPNRDDPKNRVALDIMAAAMGGDKEMGARLLSGVKRSNSADNGDRWNAPSGQGENDRQSYRRMSMTGQLLANISAPGSTLSTVGGLAQLIGDLGPEAEKVLGPGVRRTAYRYRGTEKRPDRAMVNGVNEATAAANDLDYDHYDTKDGAGERRMRSIGAGRGKIAGRATRNGGLAGGRGDKTAPNPDADKVSLSNHYWMDRRTADDGRRISEDFRTLGMRGDAAVLNLMDSLPTKELTELSVESGELPPSQGVIINANGKVVTQAMGYNGDHYLPFDLKNLNALHGGQYIRTRAAGGPTTEDIYTGLLAGARQVQVVSNSGVFTLEFDPDLRGGRRYSDKAARMISRYGKLLDTIVKDKIYQTDLPPERMRELRAQASARSNGNEDTYKRNLSALTDAARLSSQIEGDDGEDELEEAAQSHGMAAATRENAERSSRGIRPMSTRERAMVIDEARTKYESENKNQGVRRLTLDGPGYDRALRTLRQEFPYFIRQASWQSIPDYLRARQIPNVAERRRFYPSAKRAHVPMGQVHPLRQNVPTSIGGTRTAETAETTSTTSTATDRVRSRTETGQPTRRVSAAMAADGQVTEAVAASLVAAFHVFNSVDIMAQLPDPSIQEHERFPSPARFVEFKQQQFEREGVPEGRIPMAMAKWLMNPATPDRYRREVIKAVSEASTMAERAPHYDHEAVDTAGVKLAGLLSLVSPYAAPDPDQPDMAMVKPDLGDPKPQKFDGFPDTVGREAYDVYLNEQVATDPDFVTAVEELRELYVIDADGTTPQRFDHEGLANLLTEEINSIDRATTPDGAAFLKTQIAAKQKAWSFLQARHVAIVLDRLGSPAGGADPFEFSKAAAARRTITFYKADHQFARLVREHRSL